MPRIVVRALKIESFRRFNGIEIPFGDCVTIIAGQNGTSKSTLLGMLAQPFSFGVVRGKTAFKPDESKYLDNYHGLNLHEFKDLTGKPFMYDCNDVFRLSNAFDFGKKYRYETILEASKKAATIKLPGNSLVTISRDRKMKKQDKIDGMRFVTGPGASHESGEGNFPHPVIYLGLNRLWPLAISKDCKFSEDDVSEQSKQWYVDKYDQILCLNEPENNAKFIDTLEKRKFITPLSKSYDGESCSAGQDNLSQILTALISFRSLKEALGDKYMGGMLLIDELDATFHNFAQKRLLAELCAISKELRLQIIATSHSLALIEHGLQSSLKKDIKLLHLGNVDGEIRLHEFKTYQEVCDHLNIESTLPQKKKPAKVSVVFEDNEAKFLFDQICGPSLRPYIACKSTSSMGAGDLKNLGDLSGYLPELNNIIVIPDGDMAKTWKKPPKNLLALPGGKRPETLAYRHLFQMKDSDPFWKTISSTYTRQFAIIAAEGKSLETGENRDWVKQWYTKQSKYWGRANNKIFKSWVLSNKKECLQFFNKFINLLHERYKGEIPKDIITRIRTKLKHT